MTYPVLQYTSLNHFVRYLATITIHGVWLWSCNQTAENVKLREGTNGNKFKAYFKSKLLTFLPLL